MRLLLSPRATWLVVRAQGSAATAVSQLSTAGSFVELCEKSDRTGASSVETESM
jgi:hypothetical protein